MLKNRVGDPTRFPNGFNTGSSESFSGRLTTIDKTSIYEDFDDFNFLDTDEWDTTRFDTGFGDLFITGDNGILAILGGSAAPSTRGIAANIPTFNYTENSKPIWFKISFLQRSDTLFNQELLFGHVNAGIPNPRTSTNCVFFEKIDTEDIMRFVVRKEEGGGGIDEPLFTIEPDVFIELAFFWDGGGKFDIYKDDAFIKSISISESQIPTIDVGQFIYTKQPDTVNFQVDFDYIYSGKQRESFKNIGDPTRFSSGLNLGTPSNFPGKLIVPDRTSVFEHFDDFNFLDTDEWDITRFRVGPGSVINSGLNGVVNLFTVPTQFNVESISLAQTNINYVDNNRPIWFKCRMKISTIDSFVTFGHFNPTTTSPIDLSDKIAFRFDQTPGGYLVRFIMNTQLLIEPAFVEQELDIFSEWGWYYDGNGKFDIYKDNVLIKSFQFEISVLPQIDLGPVFVVQNDQASTSNFKIDYSYTGAQR